MADGWKANIRRVEPYVPGEQPAGSNRIKLNTNENPYPPAPGVKRVLEELDGDRLRLYPDPACGELVSALAGYYRVGEDQVFVGVGSDDVLGMAFLTFFNSNKPILFPAVSYSFYPVWAGLFRIPWEAPALDRDMAIRPEDYYRENGGIVFPNPNAPTGLFMPLDQVEDILAHNPDSVVIVDEAYIDFGGESARSLIPRYPNLLVTGTFSKSRSLAGMRIGFALGQPSLIKALSDVRYAYNSYTMSLAAQRAGAAAVADEAWFQETRRRIIATRERAKTRLSRLGFSFPDSMANFLFVTHERAGAGELFEALRREGIYVRYFKQPGIDNYLRISIGTDEEMEALYAFLERYFRERQMLG